MSLKLSDLKPGSYKFVGHPAGPAPLKLSDLNPSEYKFVEPKEQESYEDPAQSPVTSFTTSAIQSAVPFASSIAGAGQAGMNAITGVTGPLAGGSLSDIKQDYQRARDQFTGESKAAQEASPASSMGGALIGAGANPLFLGATTLPKAAAAGAAQGLGLSESDLTKGELPGAFGDALGGAAGGSLGYGLGKAIPAAGRGVASLGKKALTNLGPTGEAISARLAGKAKDTARSYPQLAEDMTESLMDLQKQIHTESEKAVSTLGSHAEIPRPVISNAIDQAMSDLKLGGKLIGGADKHTHSVLSSLGEDLAALPAEVSEKEVKKIIQKLDANINWDDPAYKSLNTVLRDVRTNLDQTLKFRNPSYKQAMQPVADRVSLLEDLKRFFNIEKKVGEGLKPTDTTATKIQSSLRENKAVTQEALEALKKYTGKDYSDLAQDYQNAKHFQIHSPQNSSKKTNIGIGIGGALGGGLGSLTGGIPGAALGAGVGGFLGGTADAYGGVLAGKILDSYVKSGNTAALGKFGPLVKKAAQKGPAALSTLGAILGKDLEFRKLVGI